MLTRKAVVRVGAVSLSILVGLVAAPSAHATVTACKKDLAAAKEASEAVSAAGHAGLAVAVSAGVTKDLAKAMTSCAGVTRDIESIIVKAQRLNAQSIVDTTSGRRDQGLTKQQLTYLAIQDAQAELGRAAAGIPLPARAKKALRRLVKS